MHGSTHMYGWTSRMIGSATATLDRAALGAVKLTVRAVDPAVDCTAKLAAYAHVRDETAALGELFATPPVIRLRTRLVRTTADGAVTDMDWSSGFVPALPEAFPTWQDAPANAIAHARLFTHTHTHEKRSPRPVMLLLHGFNTGSWGIEQLVWPIAALQRAGMDVAITQHPFHALRSSAKGGLPPFPSEDPAIAIEGFRQAVHDVRGLVRWLARDGAPVALCGMSLGGYVAALVATLEPSLAFAGLVTPLAAMEDVLHAQGRLGTGTRADALHDALARTLAPVSPFTRPSRLGPERALVVAASADRILPASHASRLASHFGCETVHFPGSHLAQVGIGQGYRVMFEKLASLGLANATALRHEA